MRKQKKHSKETGGLNKMPNIPKEQIQEIRKAMIEEEQNAKKKFIEALAKEIVVQMVEMGYTPKPKEREYIN